MSERSSGRVPATFLPCRSADEGALHSRLATSRGPANSPTPGRSIPGFEGRVCFGCLSRLYCMSAEATKLVW